MQIYFSDSPRKSNAVLSENQALLMRSVRIDRRFYCCIPFWNNFFALHDMNMNRTHFEEVVKAFTNHQRVSLTKKDGVHIAEGYILIMYGDFALRVQDHSPARESHFISISDIKEISVREREPSFY